jgi:hypothetical protein
MQLSIPLAVAAFCTGMILSSVFNDAQTFFVVLQYMDKIVFTDVTRPLAQQVAARSILTFFFGVVLIGVFAVRPISASRKLIPYLALLGVMGINAIYFIVVAGQLINS